MTDQTQQTLPKKNVDLARARFTIETESGQKYQDIRLMPGDIVGAERKYDIRASDFETGSKLEHMLYMVWLSARRKGYPSDFETLLEELTELDINQGDGSSNPTPPAQ